MTRAPRAPRATARPQLVDAEANPGAAIHRGATILPNGAVVRVGPSRSGEPTSTLRPTGRSRRVLGRRLPVLTGYAGGTIPTHVQGTVRVGGPTAGFWVWLATSVSALVGVLFAAAAGSVRACLAVCALYLVATIVLGSRVGPR